MALRVENNRLVGNVDNLETKLNGKLPVDRLELIYLVNSWGRTSFFYTEYLNEDVTIVKCEPNYCYDLSKLDVSQITNMDSIFEHSNYSGDISKWDVSNITSMFKMFAFNREFNSPLNNWNTSNVVCTENMFWNAISVDQNISSWNLENAVNCYCMFLNANAFMSKYNSGEDLSYYTDEIKEWLINNREKMSDIDLKDKYGKEIDMFFNKFTDINSMNKI